jgi:hypothetical protein
MGHEKLISMSELEPFQLIERNSFLYDFEKNFLIAIILFEPPELLELDPPTLFTSFETAHRLLPHLRRYKCDTKGKCYGIGKRQAMETNGNLNYRLKPLKAKDGGTFCEAEPEIFQYFAQQVSGTIHRAASSCVPHSALQREKLLAGFPIPPFSPFTSNLYVSRNFSSAPHCDRDVSTKFQAFPVDLFAFSVWFEQHATQCAEIQCISNWFFALPTYRVKFPLRNRTMMIYNSNQVEHLSHCSGRHGCNSTAWGLATQVKQNYFLAMKKVLDKNK